MSQSLILYCRIGFEADCAAEIQDWSERVQCFGYAKASAQSGFVEFVCYQDGDAERLYQAVDFHQLIFARHWFVSLAALSLDAENRVAGILAEAGALPRCGSLRMEYPDTNEGKALSSFCKKFERPLRNALQKQSLLTKQDSDKLPCLQLFFTSGTQAWLGYNTAQQASPWLNGIPRLKFPSDAPSRSTLKLDEAFIALLSEDEQQRLVVNGQKAVDLGACPGGWTYQLVRRNMFVSAVDNGPMAESLMETGQVRHYREDGFKFQPERNNISWLVCDMVEKPSRVAKLMLKWLSNGWTQHAIFNLKLPMKKRYAEVAENIALLEQGLSELGEGYIVRAKHLYHDREEITVFASRGK